MIEIEKLSHNMGPTPILEMARAYGLRPWLWLLDKTIISLGYCDIQNNQCLRKGYQP